MKEYQMTHVFSPSLPRPGAAGGRRRRPNNQDMDNSLSESRQDETLPETRRDENDVSNSVLPEPSEETQATSASDKQKNSLLDAFVDKYKKKFRKNRRGRKMGAGRKASRNKKMLGRRKLVLT